VKTIDADALTAAATRFAAHGGQPGFAYGVIAGSALVHAGGLGERWLGGPVPDADTVFRIASMTKSFTATLVLKLRDAGALGLDDPAADYVPALRGAAPGTPDKPPITIRNLLTMTAGFPTDDPWGDRQQGLDPAVFARMLADGEVRAAWAPGTKFEYSNLGYAVLGLIIESITGRTYAQAVRAEVLEPLGLNQTGYEVSEIDPDHRARGYRRDRGTWRELEPDPYGAFAPMGGIFSCVRDLAKWVAWFAGAFPPDPLTASAGLAREADLPLSRSSRREMQLGQVAITGEGAGVVSRLVGPTSISYGFGLFAEDDPAFGTIVQHSGGYPGFGSHMRWHPATGLGTVVLANSTYAQAGALAGELLSALLTAQAKKETERACYRLRGPFPGAEPWPETLAAHDAVSDLLTTWSDAVAAQIFAPNVELDQPLAERQAEIETLRERIGVFTADRSRQPEFDSPAHCRWWVTGPHGTVAVQIKLAPLRQALVQQLVIAVPPPGGSPLANALDQLIGLLSGTAPRWPSDLPSADGFDISRAERELRTATGWAGPCVLDCYLAGRDDTSATVQMTGDDGRVSLEIDVTESGKLRRLEVALLG